MQKDCSISIQRLLAGLVTTKARSIFSASTARGIQPQLATVARNGPHDGSPGKWFDPNHRHRRQRFSFFCLPGLNLRTWDQGHCVYRKPRAGPFGVWGVAHDQISPGVLKESSSVRHFAGVRGRVDSVSPEVSLGPFGRSEGGCDSASPKASQTQSGAECVFGVRGSVCLVSGRVLPGSRHGARGSGTAFLLRTTKIPGGLVGWLVTWADRSPGFRFFRTTSALRWW